MVGHLGTELPEALMVGFGGGFGNGSCWCSAAAPRAYLQPAGEAVG